MRSDSDPTLVASSDGVDLAILLLTAGVIELFLSVRQGHKPICTLDRPYWTIRCQGDGHHTGNQVRETPDN